MSQQRADALQTCPDCGGILEPSRPSWALTIDVVALRPALASADAGAWRCPLCGYRLDPAPRPDERPAERR